MILVSQPRTGVPSLSFGHRRSITSPEYRAFGLPLNGREAGLAATAGSGADRSLPMSGTSPLPLRTAHDIANRGDVQVLYAAPTPHADGFRTNPAHSQFAAHRREAPAPVYHVSRAYPPDQHALPYSHHSREDPTRLTPYGLQAHHHGAGPQGPLHPAYLPSSGAVLSETNSGLSRPPPGDGHPHTSPRSQRKTKGHVASACVPCKKAHLRCDTTRPCSRCMGSGKEDSCIDVQHKKRGRPRLRDESSRFDPSRYPHSQDAARRPLSIYPSGPMEPSSCDDHLRRAPTFGGMRDPRTSEIPIRQFNHERAPVSETSMALYGQHASAVQPLAYLNMEFEVMKASPTFVDGVRIPHILGRKLSDLVVPSQVGIVHALQGHVINEQRSREPNYLPPIMGSGLADSVIQHLGYGAEDATRFPLLRQEYFSFIGSDNMTRTLPVRLGLAKGDSHYFVVALLNLQPPPAQPQYARERPVNYHPISTPPQSVFGEPPGSNSSTYDPRRQRFSEGSIQLPSSLSSSSSGMESAAPTLTAAVTRPEYPAQGAYPPAFRGDATSTSRSSSRSFQLPPIRTRTDPRSPPREHEVARNERPGRVDIGGLIEKQSSSERHW